MVKFTEEKKKEIKKAIEVSGEQLFLKYGLKKVTIDEIINEVNIGKGTFYLFFENKYDLFLEISRQRQESIILNIESVIEGLKGEIGLNNSQSLTKVLIDLIQLYSEDEFLKMLNGDAKELLQKKASPKLLNEHFKMDTVFMNKLSDFGFQIRIPEEVFLELMNVIFIYGMDVFNNKKDERALKQLIELVTSQELIRTK